MNQILSVNELSEYIKSTVSNKRVKVVGEVSQPKLSGGHLYFNLKDNLTYDSNIKAIIWKSKNIDKSKIEAGMKVTLDGKLDYYSNGGSVNLIVDKLIIENEISELAIKYENIKQEFIKKGYFDTTHKLLLPTVIKKITIITSETGAALQDFLYNLSNNGSNLEYTIKDVMVQGTNCPKDICTYLDTYNFEENDSELIVITRGGGSFEDLFGFSQPELIESIYRFKNIPILCAIGHMVDNPLCDLVCDISCPTPSLAAQFIVDHNKKYINSITNIRDNIKNRLICNLNDKHNMFNKLNEKISRNTTQFLNTLQNNMKSSLLQHLNNRMLELKLLETKVATDNISLYYNNIKINTPEELVLIQNTFQLKWGGMVFSLKLT